MVIVGVNLNPSKHGQTKGKNLKNTDTNVYVCMCKERGDDNDYVFYCLVYVKVVEQKK